MDSADYSYSVKSISSGYNEQDPRDWIAALKDTIGTLKKKNKAAISCLNAIGIAGHMHGATLLDKNGEFFIRVFYGMTLAVTNKHQLWIRT